MNERKHFFIKIYLSHLILQRVAKGLILFMCERWVGDGDRLLYSDQKVILTIAALLSHPGRAPQPWIIEGRKPSVCKLILALAPCSPTDSNCNWNANWLPQAVCCTWLYNCLTPTCFLWANASGPNSTTSTSQGDIPISSTVCTCFAVLLLIYIGAFLYWRLGRESICYNHSLRIFQNSTCGNFLHVRLYLPHIPISQIMLKVSNSEITKINYLNHSKKKKKFNKNLN